MAVLLLILKIIGIILLILLGLILLILAVVLFVPVRYQVSGSIGEKTTARKGKKPDDGEPGEDDREDDIEEPKERSAAEDTLTDGEQKTAGTPADGEKETAGISVDGEQKTDGALAGGQQKTAGILDDGPAVLGKQRGGLFRRIWERIRAFFAGLVRKLRQFRAGIKEALKKIKDVRTFLTDERHREALPLIFTELKYLLTHFKFRRIRTDLTFSMGDPALTGQVLGGLCVLPFLYRYQVQVYPNFEAENTYVTGTFDIKGRARGLHIAVSAVRLLGKKEFRIWLKWLMHR